MKYSIVKDCTYEPIIFRKYNPFLAFGFLTAIDGLFLMLFLLFPQYDSLKFRIFPVILD